MSEYKLELSVEAKTPEEAANILYDELYNSDSNISIEARDMKEVDDLHEVYKGRVVAK